MSLLDRAIAKQFLANVVALSVILACFVVAVDVSINLDRFERTAEQMATTASGDAPSGFRRAILVGLLIADLWWPRLLQLFCFLSGTVMVAAMGFTCVQLVRHREVIAMIAAGLSVHRIARPILLASLGISTLQIAVQEAVIPRIAPLLIRDHGSAGDHSLGAISVPLMSDGAGRLLRARDFDAADEVMAGVFVIERTPAGPAERVIRADRAAWNGDAWDLEGVRIESRMIDSAAAPAAAAPAAAEYPAAVLETPLTPERVTMERSKAYERALGFAEVSRMLSADSLNDADLRARLERIRWGRFAVVACNMLALVLAVPFFISRVPVGILERTLACLPIVTTALVAGVVGSSAAFPGVPAGLGVFLPVVVLAPLAAVAWTLVRT